jgi:short subunit dehydrogenase-like uncharacterized protein
VYDLVLLGATGFTGGLTAEYLAAHAPADLRWAVAGRNQARLDALGERLGAGRVVPDRVVVDLEDSRAVRDLAASTATLVTTVGPYALHGAPVVAACAAAGTDYLDLTGEPEFVDRTYVRHHATAQATGARLVHACGFDSVPYDIGALTAVQHLPEGEPLTVRAFLSTRTALSGGTFASVVHAVTRPREAAAARADRRRLEPQPGGRTARFVVGRAGWAPAVGAWAVPMPSIDPQVVVRSARALDRYGPDFRYSQHLAVRTPLAAASVLAGAAALVVLAQVPATRRRLLARIPTGSGPSPEQRARHRFRVRLLGEGGGRRVVTEFSGGDPGYDETAKMLSEAALCLLYDDVPTTSGQVTTAVAMGDPLRDRLRAAGLTITTHDV